MAYYKSLLFLLIVICLGIILLYQLSSGYRYRWIVIHHSASPTDNYESIKRYHQRKNHWRDAGYHLILSNGSTGIPLGHLEATGRYQHLSYALATRRSHYNVLGLHLCIVGNYERTAFPDTLKPALAHALDHLQKKFHIPDDHILFHRDIGATLCPGKHITKDKVKSWKKQLTNVSPDHIKEQQRGIINQAGFSVHTVPVIFIIPGIIFTLVTVFIWLLIMFIFKSRSKGLNHKQAGTVQPEKS